MKNDFLTLLNDEIIEKIDSPEELLAIKGGDWNVCNLNIAYVCTDVNAQCTCLQNTQCLSCANTTDCSCKDKGCTTPDWGKNIIYSQCATNWVGC